MVPSAQGEVRMRIWMVMGSLVLPALLSGCPEKKTPAEAESPTVTSPASAQAPTPPAADTSGAPKEEEDEEAGW